MNNSTSPADQAPRWFFNTLVDLETWLACVTTDPNQDGQDNVAYAEPGHLVCAFAKGFEPRLRHAVMMAASQEMLTLLRECHKRLPASCDTLQQNIAAVLDLVDKTPDVEYRDIERGHVTFSY